MCQLLRIFQILSVFSRLRLDNLIPESAKGKRVRLFLACLPKRSKKDERSCGERLREALIMLGPVFVKFGQQLSTRRDLLPLDVSNELVQLQDNVPPFDNKQAFKIIEQQLGKPIDEMFAQIGKTPLAAASVAQVYAATLHSGEQVVVKIIRPDIESIIRRDIKLLYWLAGMTVFFFKGSRRLKPKEVVESFEKTILDELDLHKESANASQLRRNFENSHLIYVPKVYWPYCASKVLVLERIYGVPVSDVATLSEKKVNVKKLAEQGVEVFFTQVFRDSFFHADMHPGNVFVCTKEPENPKYIAVDFGIVGTLSQEDQSYLARNLLAFFKRDYYMVAKLHVDSGWVNPDTPVNELACVIRTVCEPIFEKPLRNISFAHILLELFTIARAYEMTVQPQLVLLQKTLLNIEGLGKQLYPDLDLWSTAQPFLEKWMKKRVSPLRALYRLHLRMPHLLEQAPLLADRALKDIQYQQRMNTIKRQQRSGKAHRSLSKFAVVGGCLSMLIAGLVWQDVYWIQSDEAMALFFSAIAMGLFFLAGKLSD